MDTTVRVPSPVVSTLSGLPKNEPANIGRYWYYATIRYQGRLLGLLVATDDEEAAWQEAEKVSGAFGCAATLLGVRKVVIQ